MDARRRDLLADAPLTVIRSGCFFPHGAGGYPVGAGAYDPLPYGWNWRGGGGGGIGIGGA